jgi:pimeloyl-ACP methyl ester carboxylesterase
LPCFPKHARRPESEAKTISELVVTVKPGVLLTFVLFIVLAAVGGCGPPYETDTDKLFGDVVPLLSSYEVAGQPVYYVQTGNPDGAAVIFIHGTPGSWDGYGVFLADERLQRSFRLIAVDRPGFGKAADQQLELSLQKQAELFHPLLGGEKGQCRPILVGHSLGAPVAARMAMDFPDEVGGVLLIAPSLDPDLEQPRWYNYLAEWRLVRWVVPEVMERANDEVFALPDELCAMVPLWSFINVPVTLIQGNKDKLVSPANVEFAERMLPGETLRTVRVAEAGHFILWKQPELIIEELIALADRCVNY